MSQEEAHGYQGTGHKFQSLENQTEGRVCAHSRDSNSVILQIFLNLPIISWKYFKGLSGDPMVKSTHLHCSFDP